MSEPTTDPLEIEAEALAGLAEREGVTLLRCKGRFLEDSNLSLSVEGGLAEAVRTAAALGVRIVYLARERLDSKDFNVLEADAYHGQLVGLAAGFPYQGVVNVWSKEAPWCAELEKLEEDADFDAIETREKEALAARAAAEEQRMPREEHERLAMIAAEHPSLKSLKTYTTAELRRQIQDRLPVIAEEHAIRLPQSYIWIVTHDATQIILERQQAALKVVNDDMEAWAEQISRDPGFDKPTAAERERYCLQLLQDHLGFPAPKTLADPIRKLADSLKKQRGKGQDLFT